jgi:hypothetical protein
MLVLLAVVASAPALALDFVPTRYDDPAPDGCLPTDCSLREAVIDANAADDADRILLSAGVYHLTRVGSAENFSATGDLDLTSDVELVGAGAGMTRIDATGLGEQPIQAAGNPGIVTAIRNLTVQNSSIFGILIGVGSHTVEDCEIRDNGTGSSGDGIAVTIQGVASIRRVTVAHSAGVGLSVIQGAATVENSTFTGNGAQEILVNLATAFSCTHCTLFDSGNSIPRLAVGGATATVANSIVAGSCALFSAGVITSSGGNVESTGHTCGFSQGTDQQDVSTVALALGALTDNGGPTRTHLPDATSVAIGGAVDALCLAGDQRGVARSTDCESGAVELTDGPVATAIFIDGFQQGNTGAWSVTVN